MALFNEINAGRFSRAIQKLTAIKGGPPTPQLATEIGVQFQIPLGVEFRYLEGWNMFGFQDRRPASVGNSCGYRMRNPTGSNVIAVIDKATFFAETQATEFVLRISSANGNPNTDLGNVATGQVLDLRSQVLIGNIIPSFATPSIAFGNAPYIFMVPLNAPFDLIQTENQELVLVPGTTLQFETTVVNVVVGMGIRWRERFLEDSERT
jgi:hypothetical protein